MAVTDEVEVAFLILHQLISILLKAINVELIIIRTSQQNCNTILTTVIIVEFTCCTEKPIQMVDNARLHITVLVEQVSLSIDDIGLTGISVD